MEEIAHDPSHPNPVLMMQETLCRRRCLLKFSKNYAAFKPERNVFAEYSELLNLRWRDVDFTSGTITIRDPKSGEDEHVLMNSTTQETLKTLWDSTTKVVQLKASGPDRSSFVFTAPRGGFIQNLKRYWYPALRRAGIDDFHFHDLRHTFASRAAMSGVDLYTLQALMRHRSALMTQRYAHLSAAHLREAIRRLDGWHERQNRIAERRS